MEYISLEKVKDYFYYLSSVPHGSGNTKAISDLVVKFAVEHGLKYVQDEVNNVVIFKDGTNGYENAPTTILQGHLDMVCAKLDNNPIDMSKTPITIIEEGNWMRANETSLGGDDISGCSIMLAILDSNTIEHPPIEAVFTIDEETGMEGANGLDYSLLKGRKMINLDSENLGEIIVGCAGGTRVSCTLPVERETSDKYVTYEVTIDSLKGGHSGNEIDKERGHSHFLMARMLSDISENLDIRVVSFNGGKFDNVIPCETHCYVAVDKTKTVEFLGEIDKFQKIYANEYACSDPNVRVVAAVSTNNEMPMTEKSSEALLNLLSVLPYGPLARNLELNSMVQTSLNMGFVNTESDKVTFAFLVRSNILTQCNFLAKRVIKIVKAFGGYAEKDEGYPCWQFVKNSKVQSVAIETFEELYSLKPNVLTIHAGLECGIFSGNLEGLDCISLGPNIFDIHSPKERMDLDSVDKLTQIVCGILKKIK